MNCRFSLQCIGSKTGHCDNCKSFESVRKHRNEPVMTPDGRFDSKGEYQRWCELKILLSAKLISNLERQKSFPLTNKNPGMKRVFFRPDFSYSYKGIDVIEDFKSPHTAAMSSFRNKVKLFIEKYPNYRVRISSNDGVVNFK